MLFLPILIGTASGKLNGVVASRNRGGQYLKQFTTPTDPATANQAVLRTAIANAHTAWSALTSRQRQEWQDYSIAHPRANRIGQPHPIGGYAEFVRRYVPRDQIRQTLAAGLVVGTGVPAGFYDFDTAPTAEVNAGGNRLLVTWTASAWTTEANSGFYVQMWGPLAATINWHRSPLRLVGFVPGNAFAPPTSPSTINIPAAMQPASGQGVAWRIRMTRAGYDLGTPYFGISRRP